MSWYITFGLGTPDAQLYTEIQFPANSLLTREGMQRRARSIAFERYGKAWAFDYPPEQFEDAIAAYNLRLREVVTA